jgi:hypothetical protein
LTVDVFADVFGDDDNQEKGKPVKETSIESKIVMTFKEGAGFDSSWTVVHAGSVEEADAILDDKFAALLTKQKKVAAFYRGSDAPQTRSAPAQATEAPSGTPAAPGPDWVYKTGVNAKTGKTWKAWMPPRGSTENPVWL